MIFRKKEDKISKLLISLWNKQDQAQNQDLVEFALTHLSKRLKLEIIKDWCVFSACWVKENDEELLKLIEQGKILVGIDDKDE